MKNTKGNVSVFRFEDNETYTMKDLLYVNSQHNSIEKMYRFLHVFYLWTQNKEHSKTATQVVKDYKINLNVISLMKEYQYLDENINWIANSPPSKADAVFLRIKMKEKATSL